MGDRRERVLTPHVRLLRDVREERGVGLRELADASGIHRSYLSMIEHGRLAPTSRELRLIGAALGVPAERLSVRTFLVVEESAA